METTLDSILDIRLRQPRRGYRFSMDAVLLHAFVNLRRAGRILDLGAGCGVVGLLLAGRYPAARVVLLELQQGLFRLAEENIALNGLEGRVEALQGDIRALPGGMGLFDLAVSNPPFRKPLSGRLSEGEEKAVARHEMRLKLGELVAAAASVLREKGRFCLVYHPLRLPELMGELSAAGLEPKRALFVHGRKTAEARMVLVEAAKGGRPGLKVEPPIFVYEDGGGYTGEVREIYGLA
ncbi:MAG: methyltransferase [Thermodesulfovibrionales bacterium]